jgi:HSP20 family molecular chaperone IbpA
MRLSIATLFFVPFVLFGNTLCVSAQEQQPFPVVLSSRDNENEKQNQNNKNNDLWFPFPRFSSSLFDDFNRRDDPFSSFNSILDEMRTTERRFFSSFFDDDNDNGLVMQQQQPRLRGSPSLFQQQNYDIIDDDEKFQVSLRVPDGLTSKDVQIEVQDGGTRLFIHGRVDTTTTTADASQQEENSMAVPQKQQYRSFSFSQSFSLDRTVEVDQIVATMKGGLLTIRAPKDERKVKNVNIDIPIRDLDEIAAAVTSSAKLDSSKHHTPHFPHMALLGSRKKSSEQQVLKEQGAERVEEEKVDQTEDVAPKANSITDGWREVSETTL